MPRLLGLETDPAALGAPFFLMERVAGRVPNENPLYHLEGWFHDLASEELRQYWFSGIDTVAAVARVDWRARGLGSVSYTHLAHRTGQGPRAGAGDERREDPRRAGAAGPVSYTHLDVYKRQAHR